MRHPSRPIGPGAAISAVGHAALIIALASFGGGGSAGLAPAVVEIEYREESPASLPPHAMAAATTEDSAPPAVASDEAKVAPPDAAPVKQATVPEEPAEPAEWPQPPAPVQEPASVSVLIPEQPLPLRQPKPLNRPGAPVVKSRQVRPPSQPAAADSDSSVSAGAAAAEANSPSALQQAAPGSGVTPLPDGGLKAYARLIWSRIERAKPKGVSEPGVAVVTFSVAADGSLVSPRISASTGFPSLDRTALECLRKASPFPPPPPGAAPEQLVFSVPFAFR